MRLVELAIRRMPGIHEPFTLGPGELGGGLHVVHGPNGVGKTSLCRAAHALLWPETFRGAAISVAARFEQGQHVWHAQRDGEQVEWQRDGASCAPPEVPDRHLARCFLVTIEDLYDRRDEPGAEGNGRWFAEQVLREMAGGYDVRKAREPFERGARHGHGELGELRTARDLVATRRLEQERVLEEERALAGLEREHTEARAAAAELEALGTASERLAAHARLEGGVVPSARGENRSTSPRNPR